MAADNDKTEPSSPPVQGLGKLAKLIFRRLSLLVVCIVVCELIAEVGGGLAFQAIDDLTIRRYAIGAVQLTGLTAGFILFARMGRER